ncbi:MAG: MmgE/PrpD family protein [Burkholderiales bacterium]|nr:MmgE/PrpD family protein [Burkholderiales bacterium]
MRALSAYVAGASRRKLPRAVADKTKHHIMDTLAAMVSGSRLAPGAMAISYARRLGGVKEACIAGTRLVTSSANAALANAMMAHADETDDSHQLAFYHPGCAVVPAALAVAERESSNGSALLSAVALGYDIGCRVNFALGAMRFHLAGHSTHSFGALFGAAAAAGALVRLSPAQARWLLSYTAQQASGISCWMRDPDHIEKAFDFGGMPARNGVSAALMVASGMSGVDDVFSGERNFLYAFGGEDRAAELARGLGERYEILNANIKKWSVGSPIQAALDSMQELIRCHGLKAGDVKKVKIQVQDHEAAIVNDRDMPDICLQHLIAVMLIDGTVTFATSHDVARMKNRGVLDLRKKIELCGSAELTRSGGRQAIVEVWMNDGRHVRHHTRAVKGTSGNPMTRAEVDEKCVDLLAPVLGRRKTRALVDAVWDLEKLNDIRILRPLLQP